MNGLDFPLQEYESRVKRIQNKMGEKGLDTFIVLGPENIHYVCGYDGAWTAPVGELSGVVIPREGEPRLMVRSLESKTAKKQATKNPRTYIDGEGPWKAFREIMDENKATKGTVGVEENIITLRRFNRLKENLPEAKIVSVVGLVESVMAEPSRLEIEFTKKAGEITKVGFKKAIEATKEGAPLYEVAAQAETAMFRAGMTEQRVSGSYILSVVWGGPDGGAMHETDVTRKIQKGDLVSPEIWGNYKHYIGASQGTVFVGKKPPSKIADVYKVLAEMYVAVREAIKPGVSVGEAWDAGSKVYRAAYGVDYYRMLGPQVGAGFVGRLDRGVKDPLRPGATYLVQPQVNDPLLITVAASLMVTEKGCEEITTPLLELKTI